jgi:hypothetical protein
MGRRGREYVEKYQDTAKLTERLEQVLFAHLGHWSRRTWLLLLPRSCIIR